MNVRGAQRILEETFAAPTAQRSALAAPDSMAPSAGAARELGEILTSLGRLDAETVQRIRALKTSSKRSFQQAATKLKAVSPEDLQTAVAIQHGSLRAERAAFGLSRHLSVIRRPYSPEAEQFRHLRTRLATTAADRLGSLAIAPVDEWSRAEHVAANLAAAFALLKRRTLVIDAGLRTPSLAPLLAVSRGPGLNGLLSGIVSFEDAVLETPVEALSLLSAGAANADPQALFAGEMLRKTLEEAKARYDVVIILTSPFGPVADGQFVWSAAKSAIAVARRDMTRAEPLKDMNVIFRQIGAELIGSVMTR
jgi:capsular exopolysaccharide synthesis family protein